MWTQWIDYIITFVIPCFQGLLKTDAVKHLVFYCVFRKCCSLCFLHFALLVWSMDYKLVLLNAFYGNDLDLFWCIEMCLPPAASYFMTYTVWILYLYEGLSGDLYLHPLCLCLLFSVSLSLSEALIRHPAVEAGKGNADSGWWELHDGQASAMMRLEKRL